MKRQNLQHRLVVAITILISLIATSLVADDHYMIIAQKGMTECVNIDSVDSVILTEDSMIIVRSRQDSIIYSYPIDNVTFSTAVCDTLNIHWHSNGVSILNPLKSEGVDVVADGGHVRIENKSCRNISILLSGESADGSLLIDGNSSADIVMDGLCLANPIGGAITLLNDSVPSSVILRNSNNLSDGTHRDSTIIDNQRACITAAGNLSIRGDGKLELAGKFKHAIYSDKKLSINSCVLVVDSACNDGLRSKKSLSINHATIKIDNTGKNSINSEKSSVSIEHSIIDVTLRTANTKGIASEKNMECRHSVFDIKQYANATKGMKSKGNITLVNDTIAAYATGGVIIKDEDKTYCSIIKSDSCLTMENCYAQVQHSGVGGKGFCSDSTFTLIDSKIDMLLTGFGAPYLINDGSELDYFTPRCIESKNCMNIISGEYSYHATGTGGKGIVCDSTLIIGNVGESDSNLIMKIITEGTAVIDDVFTDNRYGCPKAIKCGNRLVIESGIIRSQTMGMGGEGVESKGTLTVNGGKLVCESFDDGINVEGGITINGGSIYATSVDNDGIDSNGFIALNGGVVASITSHERDEDFDCDDETFFLNGGTICGIGRDYSGIYRIGQPYYQHIAYIRDKEHFKTDTIAAYNIYKNKYITYTDAEGNPVMTVLVHDNIPAAFATLSCPTMQDGAEVRVYQTNNPPQESKPLIDGKVWIGGKPFDSPPLFTGTATIKPYEQIEQQQTNNIIINH